jgi:outer membrane biosynthesis protein TonB
MYSCGNEHFESNARQMFWASAAQVFWLGCCSREATAAPFSAMQVRQVLPEAYEPGRSGWTGLLVAFVASLLLHAVLFGTYKAGQYWGWWEALHWKPLVRSVRAAVEQQQAMALNQPLPPMMFVDVNPATENVEPDKDTPYYSDRASKAANPLTEEQKDTPLFTGTQEEMVRTHDVVPAKPEPLQPAPPKPEPEAKPEPLPETPEIPAPKGDLLLAKADDSAKPAEPKPSATPERPRTLKEAMARLTPQELNALAGRKMRQDGGVRRLDLLSSLDVRSSPFGEYDRAIILAIQNRWFDLLDMRGFSSGRSGKVVLAFRLHYDGRITDMQVMESTVDDILSLLCQKAILDPAPYEKWPSDMRRMIGENFREVKVAFYYH